MKLVYKFLLLLNICYAIIIPPKYLPIRKNINKMILYDKIKIEDKYYKLGRNSRMFINIFIILFHVKILEYQFHMNFPENVIYGYCIYKGVVLPSILNIEIKK